MGDELSAIFTASTAASTGLEEELRALVEAGATAWPSVKLAPAVFVRHVAERTEQRRAALHAIHGPDLYLACACGEGDPTAARVFAESHLARVPEYLTRFRASPEFCDDVRQVVGEHLLVGAGASPPKIRAYAGRGSLAAWLRIVVVRAALRLRHRAQAHDEAGEAAARLLGSAVTPELDLLRRRYAGEFAAAMREAFTRLSPDQRLVVRLSWREGLTGDQIASALHVHRATVVRWIASAREVILREATAHLCRETGMSQSEADSLVGVLQSHLDLTVSQLFGGSSA